MRFYVIIRSVDCVFNWESTQFFLVFDFFSTSCQDQNPGPFFISHPAQFRMEQNIWKHQKLIWECEKVRQCKICQLFSKLQYVTPATMVPLVWDGNSKDVIFKQATTTKNCHHGLVFCFGTQQLDTVQYGMQKNGTIDTLWKFHRRIGTAK